MRWLAGLGGALLAILAVFVSRLRLATALAGTLVAAAAGWASVRRGS